MSVRPTTKTTTTSTYTQRSALSPKVNSLSKPRSPPKIASTENTSKINQEGIVKTATRTSRINTVEAKTDKDVVKVTSIFHHLGIIMV